MSNHTGFIPSSSGANKSGAGKLVPMQQGNRSGKPQGRHSCGPRSAPVRLTQGFSAAGTLPGAAFVPDPRYSNPDQKRIFDLLMDGHLVEAGRLSELVPNSVIIADPPSAKGKTPYWKGERLEPGTMLVILTMEGFGDTFQFIRYIRWAVEKVGEGVTVAVMTDPYTLPLLRTSHACQHERIVLIECPRAFFVGHRPGQEFALPTMPDELPKISATCQVSMLPFLCGPMTVHKPYLHTTPEAVEKWAQIVGSREGDKPRIGLCWEARHAAATPPPASVFRSCPAHYFAQLVEKIGDRAQFFSLVTADKGERTRSRTTTIPGAVDITEGFRDWGQTAGAIANLDMVIAVDTAICHLSAGMGKPTYTLLPSHADWRYGRHPEQTPWYPTMQLFRQDTPGDWQGVIDRVVAASGSH